MANEKVLLVLADAETIFERQEVEERLVDVTMKAANALLPTDGAKWRRGITYREPVNSVCSCGVKHCAARHDPRDRRADLGSTAGR